MTGIVFELLQFRTKIIFRADTLVIVFLIQSMLLGKNPKANLKGVGFCILAVMSISSGKYK